MSSNQPTLSEVPSLQSSLPSTSPSEQPSPQSPSSTKKKEEEEEKEEEKEKTKEEKKEKEKEKEEKKEMEKNKEKEEKNKEKNKEKEKTSSKLPSMGPSGSMSPTSQPSAYQSVSGQPSGEPSIPSLVVSETPSVSSRASSFSAMPSSHPILNTWHESITAPHTCTNSPSYPPAWDEFPAARAYFFFQNAEDCCSTKFPSECDVVDVNEKGSDSCSECTWHPSVVDPDTCTNSPLYPPAWKQPGAGSLWFFDNADDCCDAMFPLVECSAVDVDAQNSEVETGGFTNLGPVTIDDFERPELVLPFDFGSPPQWKLEKNHKNQENKKNGSPNLQSGLYSLTNIPVHGLGATADLTLKFHVDSPSKLLCTAHINTGMPFETFVLLVNGENRNTYFQAKQELVKIETGFGPGKHTVVFRVMNSEFDPGTERVVSLFGTGKVRLDVCEVRSLII